MSIYSHIGFANGWHGEAPLNHSLVDRTGSQPVEVISKCNTPKRVSDSRIHVKAMEKSIHYVDHMERKVPKYG